MTASLPKEKKVKFLARQGDILILGTDQLPIGTWPVERDGRGRVILAVGEATGHYHAIADPDVELYETAEAADRWLRVGQAGAVLIHEEHAPIQLPGGNYIVRRQREYTPELSRAVAD